MTLFFTPVLCSGTIVVSDCNVLNLWGPTIVQVFFPNGCLHVVARSSRDVGLRRFRDRPLPLLPRMGVFANVAMS